MPYMDICESTHHVTMYKGYYDRIRKRQICTTKQSFEDGINVYLYKYKKTLYLGINNGQRVIKRQKVH